MADKKEAATRRLRRKGPPPPVNTTTAVDPPVDPPVDPIVEAQRKLEAQRRLAQERELLFDVAGERSLRETLKGLAFETAAVMPAPPPFVASKPIRGASRETALLVLSDWHAYEVVKKERTQGFNEYNAEIFARRAKRVIDTAISITKRMEAGNGWQVDSCVVAANGDFISGTIHDVERHSDAPNVVMAVYGCAATLACALRDLAGQFRKVEVMCTSGNHGRLPDHKKMSAKDPTRNWDTMIYLLAEAMLRDCKNVKFYIPDSYVISYEIGSKRFVQYHGQGIKSWASIPFYGIARWTRGVQALKGQKLEPVSYFVISHFHSDSSMPSPGGQTKINGSLIGGTEFSVNDLGASDPPSQKLMFVSDPVGVNSEWAVYGEVDGETYPRSYPVYPWIR
jgi:hypothetical protein